LRIAHLDQRRVFPDGVAWFDVAFLDTPVDSRGNPANLFRNERAEAVHAEDQLAALDLAGHDCGALDAGRRRLKLRQDHSRNADGAKSQYQIKDAANAPVAFDFFTAWNVHNLLRSSITNCRARQDRKRLKRVGATSRRFLSITGTGVSQNRNSFGRDHPRLIVSQ